MRPAVIIGKVGYPGRWQFITGTFCPAGIGTLRFILSDRIANKGAFFGERAFRLPRRLTVRQAEQLADQGVYTEGAKP